MVVYELMEVVICEMVKDVKVGSPWRAQERFEVYSSDQSVRSITSTTEIDDWVKS